jgi:hypothetical protein
LQVEGPAGFQTWRSQVVEVASEIVHSNVPLTPVGPDGSPRVTVTPDGVTPTTLTVPVGGMAGLSDETFGILVEVPNGFEIVTERSMYGDTAGLWRAAGTTLVGTRLR